MSERGCHPGHRSGLMRSIDLSHLDPTALAEQDGECVLVGLTIDETHEHLRYFADRDAGRDRPAQVMRNRYLHGKHEVARHLRVLGNPF